MCKAVMARTCCVRTYVRVCCVYGLPVYAVRVGRGASMLVVGSGVGKSILLGTAMVAEPSLGCFWRVRNPSWSLKNPPWGYKPDSVPSLWGTAMYSHVVWAIPQQEPATWQKVHSPTSILVFGGLYSSTYIRTYVCPLDQPSTSLLNYFL